LDPLLAKLAGVDRRSIGEVAAVVSAVEADPALFPRLMDGLDNPDTQIAQRAADAAEKLTRRFPGWLAPFKRRLVEIAGQTSLAAVRWHCAQMLQRLAWTAAEKQAVFLLLLDYLEDKSSITRACALQGLWELSAGDAALREQVRPIVARLARSGSAAVKARGRKLLAIGRHTKTKA
jgi:hypothetical protein